MIVREKHYPTSYDCRPARWPYSRERGCRINTAKRQPQFICQSSFSSNRNRHSELPVRMIIDVILHDDLLKEDCGFFSVCCGCVLRVRMVLWVKQEHKPQSAKRAWNGIPSLDVAFLP